MCYETRERGEDGEVEDGGRGEEAGRKTSLPLFKLHGTAGHLAVEHKKTADFKIRPPRAERSSLSVYAETIGVLCSPSAQVHQHQEKKEAKLLAHTSSECTSQAQEQWEAQGAMEIGCLARYVSGEGDVRGLAIVCPQPIRGRIYGPICCHIRQQIVSPAPLSNESRML